MALKKLVEEFEGLGEDKAIKIGPVDLSEEKLKKLITIKLKNLYPQCILPITAQEIVDSSRDFRTYPGRG